MKWITKNIVSMTIYLHMGHYLLGVSCQKTIKYFAMFHKELIIKQPGWSVPWLVSWGSHKSWYYKLSSHYTPDLKYYHSCWHPWGVRLNSHACLMVTLQIAIGKPTQLNSFDFIIYRYIYSQLQEGVSAIISRFCCGSQVI